MQSVRPEVKQQKLHKSCRRWVSALAIDFMTGCWTEVERSLAGRFGFVELRTEELAAAAMQLDKVELCGRSINVGRPKGYVEPPPGARPVAALGAAQVLCRQLLAP